VELGPVSDREAHVGHDVGLRRVEKAGELGQFVPELIGDLRPWAFG
jgi:hypothetical protein